MGLQSPRLGLAIDQLASLHFLDGNIHLAPITIDDFHRDWMLPGAPVILRGFAKMGLQNAHFSVPEDGLIGSGLSGFTAVNSPKKEKRDLPG